MKRSQITTDDRATHAEGKQQYPLILMLNNKRMVVNEKETKKAREKSFHFYMYTASQAVVNF